MIYKYNPEDQNFRPVTILELLHQEYSLPSDFRNAYQKLISDIRKEQEKRRRRFIDIAAKVLNCPVDQVEIRAREIYQKKVLEDRRAEIERMKTAVVRFKMTAQHAETLRKLRQERPEANINIKPEEYDTKCHTMIVKGTRSFFPGEIENEKDMALDYSKKKGEEASDRDLFNALRVQDMSDWVKLSQEEIALEQAWGEWEKVFGDGNILEVEMKGKYPEVLNLDAGSNEEADRFQEVGKIENSISDLPFTNLVDVAVWKKDQESTTGELLTDREFCKRYTYKRGKEINPGSLRAARNGTGLYLKRNAKDIILDRQRKSS